MRTANVVRTGVYGVHVEDDEVLNCKRQKEETQPPLKIPCYPEATVPKTLLLQWVTFLSIGSPVTAESFVNIVGCVLTQMLREL